MFSNYSKRPITLLVVLPTKVMRADIKGGPTPKIKRLVEADRPARTPLTAAAELAMSLSDAKPSQRTVLLAEDLWSGIIDIDDRAIHSLDGDELNQMLKFETESLSNLDPMTAYLGFIELSPVPPDTRRFWCTSVASDVMMGVATAVSLRGGRFAFCAHPIGMANPEMTGVPWIEFSQVLAGAFSIGGDGLPRASIATRSKTSDRWYQALEVNFGSELPEEGWLMPAAEPADAYKGTLQSLDIEATLNRWLSAVAGRVSRSETIPVVAPLVPEASARTLTRIGTAAILIVASACGSHFVWSEREKSAIEQEIVELEESSQEQHQLNADLKMLNEQIDELETELQEARVKESELLLITGRSDRFSLLLKFIASGRDENLVLDEIAVQSTGLQLIGRAIRSDSAANLAMYLSPRIAEMGWKVEAPAMQGTNQLLNGGPWKFAIDLVDIFPKVDAKSGSATSVARVSSE